MYRITPANVTGVVNHNTADAPGDITFVISKKNVTQVSERAIRGHGGAHAADATSDVPAFASFSSLAPARFAHVS